MASLMAPISALFFMMAAKMGHTEPQHCAGIPPINEFWYNFHGVCYIQLTLVTNNEKLAPYKCAFTKQSKQKQMFGKTMFSAIDLNCQLKTSKKFIWGQVDENFDFATSNKGNPPPAQVVDLLFFNSKQVLQAIIYRNEIGYILVSCNMPKPKTIGNLEVAYICTKDRIVATAQLQQLKNEAEALGLDLSYMVRVDQIHC